VNLNQDRTTVAVLALLEVSVHGNRGMANILGALHIHFPADKEQLLSMDLSVDYSPGADLFDAAQDFL
jgi:hypothetical protein